MSRAWLAALALGLCACGGRSVLAVTVTTDGGEVPGVQRLDLTITLESSKVGSASFAITPPTTISPASQETLSLSFGGDVHGAATLAITAFDSALGENALSSGSSPVTIEAGKSASVTVSLTSVQPGGSDGGLDGGSTDGPPVVGDGGPPVVNGMVLVGGLTSLPAAPTATGMRLLDQRLEYPAAQCVSNICLVGGITP